VALWLTTRTLEPTGLRRSMSKKRIILKLDYNAAWKALHNNAFESHESSPTVVFKHANASSLGEVEVAETIRTRLRIGTTWWTTPTLSVEARIAEVRHEGSSRLR
jgi:hypothetical protein